jgi:hypothetical protein
MRKTLIVVPACLLALGVLAGCGSDSKTSSTPPNPTTTSTSSAGLVIDAKIRGNDIEPNGQRLQVKLGEPITINVDADRDGELHVHSTPEQELEYKAGKTTLHLAPITTPGIIVIEDHVADKTLVSLEVS